MLGADHPSIWKFIDGLKNEPSLNEEDVNQLISGFHPIQRNKQYKDISENILNFAKNYRNIPILTYLEGISNHFNFN
jgi:hypothetical protein